MFQCCASKSKKKWTEGPEHDADALGVVERRGGMQKKKEVC